MEGSEHDTERGHSEQEENSDQIVKVSAECSKQTPDSVAGSFCLQLQWKSLNKKS